MSTATPANDGLDDIREVLRQYPPPQPTQLDRIESLLRDIARELKVRRVDNWDQDRPDTSFVIVQRPEIRPRPKGKPWATVAASLPQSE